MTLSYASEERYRLLDDVADEILEQAQVVALPVNAIALARELGIVVTLDSQQPTRARHKQIMQQHAIFLKPDVRPERMQWAAAHELGEVFAWRVFDQQDDVDRNDINDAKRQGVYREEVANLLASRILLPHRKFWKNVVTFNSDLHQLKNVYSTASYELIAMRLLDDTESQLIVSVCDQGKISRRKSNMPRSASSLTVLEQECWQEGHQTGQPVSRVDDTLRVQCFPIHEPHWKREILLTTPLDVVDCW